MKQYSAAWLRSLAFYSVGLPLAPARAQVLRGAVAAGTNHALSPHADGTLPTRGLAPAVGLPAAATLAVCDAPGRRRRTSAGPTLDVGGRPAGLHLLRTTPPARPRARPTRW